MNKIISVCAYCGKVKDPNGNATIEYVAKEGERVSHGICNGCLEKELKEIENS